MNDGDDQVSSWHWVQPNGSGMRYMRRLVILLSCMAVFSLQLLPYLVGNSDSLVSSPFDVSRYKDITPLIILVLGVMAITWYFYFSVAATGIGVADNRIAIRRRGNITTGRPDELEYTNQAIAVNGISVVLNVRSMGGKFYPIYNDDDYAGYISPVLGSGRKVPVTRMMWIHMKSLNARYVAMTLMIILFTATIIPT